MIRILLRVVLFLIPVLATADEAPVHISAYYYPWYHSDGRHWSEGYSGKTESNGPKTGEYSSRDPETIVQQVKWSHQAGISNWICAWWGKESWEDVTLQYRVAPVLNQVTDADQKHPVTFCIFYESEGLLGIDPSKGIEFNGKVTRKFLDDFGYLSDTYFSHPAYYRIEGRPVVYLYLTRTWTGNYRNAIDLARAAAGIRGFELFLVGDEVYWGEPDENRIKLFDAITSYNMHGPEPVFEDSGDWTPFLQQAGDVYKKYKNVAGQLGVQFIPGIMPGFNSHGADPTRAHYIIPREFRTGAGEKKVFLKEMIKTARPTLDGKIRSIAVTSFNEWHEGTQIEPSRNDEERFPVLYDLSTGEFPD